MSGKYSAPQFSTRGNLHDCRAVPPETTLARVEPLLLEFGITRVSNQTGFDRLGIPVFAAVRPDARSIAVNQGKGVNIQSAKVSATMEAVEFAVAEQPECERLELDTKTVERRGELSQFLHLLPHDACQIPERLTGISGKDLLSGRCVFAPIDVVNFDPKSHDIAGICKTTNGLASGNTLNEAIFHAICELIERDAETLWWLSSFEHAAKTAISPRLYKNQTIDELHHRIIKSGMQLRLFEVTSDIQVPAVLAMIYDPATPQYPLVCGYSAHLHAATAAIKAITEAAQSRIAWLTGVRDDLTNEQYWQPVSSLQRALLDVEPGSREPSTCVFAPDTDQDETSLLLGALEAAQISEVQVFELTSSERPFSVVKVLSPDLEDREPNLHWRPRRRALEALVS